MRALLAGAAVVILLAAGCATANSNQNQNQGNPTSTNNGGSDGTPTSTSSVPSGWNSLMVGAATSVASIVFPGAADASYGIENLVVEAALGTAVENPGTKSVPDRTLRVFTVTPNDARLNGCAFSELGWDSGRVPSSTIGLKFGSSPYVFCENDEADAAAGNRYNMKTFTTPFGGNVLAVEFIVHSVVCENFPNPAAQCAAYDEARDTAIDGQILATIR
jgi:hypothetical protein